MDKLVYIFGPVPQIAAVLLAMVTPLGMLVSRHAPVPNEPVVVIAAPWNDVASVADAVSATLIEPGRVASVGLVYAVRADLVPALKAAGAWLVLDGSLSNAFCTRG